MTARGSHSRNPPKTGGAHAAPSKTGKKVRGRHARGGSISLSFDNPESTSYDTGSLKLDSPRPASRSAAPASHDAAAIPRDAGTAPRDAGTVSRDTRAVPRESYRPAPYYASQPTATVASSYAAYGNGSGNRETQRDAAASYRAPHSGSAYNPAPRSTAAPSPTPTPAPVAQATVPQRTINMPPQSRPMPLPFSSSRGTPPRGGNDGNAYSRQNGNDSSAYSRQNYGSGNPAIMRSRSKSRAKQVGIGIAAALGVLLIAAAAYLLWFTNALDRALAPNRDQLEAIDSQLVQKSLDEPFYVLVLGSDSREGSAEEQESESYQNGQERSDVIMLIRIDAKARQLTLVSVPRDTPYTKSDGSVVKINEVYNEGGAAASIAAVSDLTGVDISHYAEVRISEMESIVDSLGGIEVNVDREMKVTDSITGEQIVLEPGVQTLNGQQAQAFLRVRHAYSDTGNEDGARQSNVRTFVSAVIDKILDRSVTELPGTVLDLAQYITTDFTSGDLISLAMKLGGGKITTYSCSGPTDGAIMEQYDGKWMCYPNPEGWAELMRQVDAGQKPEDIDYAATAIV